MLTFLFIVFAVLSLAGGVLLNFTLRKDSSGEFDGFNFKFRTASVLAVVAMFVFFGLAKSNINVDSGNRGILKRFGRVAGNLEPGLHFIRPVGDEVIEFPVQARIVKPHEDAASKDLQIVYFEVTFRYHIDPAFADYVLIQYNGDPEARVIDPAILEAIKSVTSQYDVQELVNKRPLVRDGIDAFVTKTLLGTHVIPEAVAITDFKFSKDYEDSIEKKQVAQQKAEQATNDLQRIKVEAEQAKAEADGKAQAAISAAKGEAESVLIVAKAKAEAQRVQKESITTELLQMRTIELLHDKWDGGFPQTYMGGGGLNPTLLIQPPANREKK